MNERLIDLSAKEQPWGTRISFLLAQYTPSGISYRIAVSAFEAHFPCYRQSYDPQTIRLSWEGLTGAEVSLDEVCRVSDELLAERRRA